MTDNLTDFVLVCLFIKKIEVKSIRILKKIPGEGIFLYGYFLEVFFSYGAAAIVVRGGSSVPVGGHSCFSRLCAVIDFYT